MLHLYIQYETQLVVKQNIGPNLLICGFSKWSMKSAHFSSSRVPLFQSIALAADAGPTFRAFRDLIGTSTVSNGVQMALWTFVPVGTSACVKCRTHF